MNIVRRRALGLGPLLAACGGPGPHPAPPPSAGTAAMAGFIELVPDQAHGNVMSVEAVDMNNDSVLDLVVSRGGADAGERNGQVEVLYGPHVVPMGLPCREATPATPALPRWEGCTQAHGCSGRAYSKLAVGDLDDDGCRDIVVGDFGGGAFVFFADKVAQGRCELPAKGVELPETRVVGDVAITDVDADGKLDIVAARGAPSASGMVEPGAYLNQGGRRFAAQDWFADELRQSADVIAVALDGDGARDDVLFGARQVRAAGGSSEVAWGMGYRRSGGALPANGQPFKLAGVTEPEDMPFNVGMVDLSRRGAAPELAVVLSGNWCSNRACFERSLVRTFSWNGQTMQPTTHFGALPAGRWLPGSVGAINADDVVDAAFGRASGDYAHTEGPGWLHLFQSASGSYQQTVELPEAYFIRAIAVADLNGDGAASAGGDVVVGTAGEVGGNGGRIHAFLRCTPR